jgi:ABC-type nitrate/sulfonate/bicarbonate transport system permease component
MGSTPWIRMVRTPISYRRKVILGIVSILFCIGIYSFFSYRQHEKNPLDTTMPSLIQMVHGAHETVQEHGTFKKERWLFKDLKATGIRLGVGFVLAISLGIVLGMLMGCFGTWDALLLPPLSIISAIAPTAMLAVFMVVVGIGLEFFWAIVMFGVTPILAISMSRSVKNVPDELIYKCYTLEASHAEVICCMIFRDILPSTIDAIRAAWPMAVVYIVAAEGLCGGVGIGYRIHHHSHLSDMKVAYPMLLLLAGLSYGIDYVLRLLRKVSCEKWSPA